MATTPRQETAQIFQFPVRPRRSDATVHSPTQLRGPDCWAARPVMTSDFGSGWYHEAAMEQAEHNPKH